MDLDLRLGQASVSRRSFLGVLGLAGAAAVVGACGGSPPATSRSGTGSPAPTGNVETSLSMCAWPDDVNPDNIELFKRRFGITAFQYDVCATNEALAAALRTRPLGPDIATPAAGQVPRLIEAGLIQKLDRSRLPNARRIDAAFRHLAWDPTDEYQLPKDYGTTGILYRSSLVHEPLTTWREFRALVTSARYSGRTVFVDSVDDVLAFPLKLLGHSLNSIAKSDLDAARAILVEVAPHILALDSTGYGERIRTGEAAMALGWSAPVATLRADPAASDATYVVPNEGTLFWLDTWVLAAGASHPGAAHAWLNFIHEPEVQANEANYTGHASPNNDAKELVDPALLADAAVFPPEAVLRKLEGAGDTSASAQRSDIWEEFRTKVAQG